MFDTYIEEDASERRFLLHIVKMQEHIMGDTTKLKADVATLAAKVDELLAKQVPATVDDQPDIDAVDTDVQAIIAKIPA